MDILEVLSESIQNGSLDETVKLTAEALKKNIPPQKILDEALIKAMGITGDRFKDGEIFVPEMLIAARAMNSALKILEPVMLEASVKAKGKLLIGTVQGDLHDIGKNLVCIMFKGAGFDVVDLGSDVSVERFVSAAKEHVPDIIGISSLLTTTMNYMQLVIEGLRKNGVKSKVIVGGAPVTADFAAKITADGYAGDAASAVDLGRSLLGLV